MQRSDSITLDTSHKLKQGVGDAEKTQTEADKSFRCQRDLDYHPNGNDVHQVFYLEATTEFHTSTIKQTNNINTDFKAISYGNSHGEMNGDNNINTVNAVQRCASSINNTRASVSKLARKVTTQAVIGAVNTIRQSKRLYMLDEKDSCSLLTKENHLHQAYTFIDINELGTGRAELELNTAKKPVLQNCSAIQLSTESLSINSSANDISTEMNGKLLAEKNSQNMDQLVDHQKQLSSNSTTRLGSNQLSDSEFISAKEDFSDKDDNSVEISIPHSGFVDRCVLDDHSTKRCGDVADYCARPIHSATEDCEIKYMDIANVNQDLVAFLKSEAENIFYAENFQVGDKGSDLKGLKGTNYLGRKPTITNNDNSNDPEVHTNDNRKIDAPTTEVDQTTLCSVEKGLDNLQTDYHDQSGKPITSAWANAQEFYPPICTTDSKNSMARSNTRSSCEKSVDYCNNNNTHHKANIEQAIQSTNAEHSFSDPLESSEDNSQDEVVDIIVLPDLPSVKTCTSINTGPKNYSDAPRGVITNKPDLPVTPPHDHLNMSNLRHTPRNDVTRHDVPQKLPAKTYNQPVTYPRHIHSYVPDANAYRSSHFSQTLLPMPYLPYQPPLLPPGHLSANAHHFYRPFPLQPGYSPQAPFSNLVQCQEINGCCYFPPPTVPPTMSPENLPSGLQYGYPQRGKNTKAQRLSSRFSTQAGKFHHHTNFYVKSCAETIVKNVCQ